MRLPSYNEPLQGKHITDLIELLKTQSSNIFAWLCVLSNTGVTYLCPYVGGDSAYEATRLLLLPRAGTIKNLSIKHSSPGNSAHRVVYTVRLNQKDTALVASLKGTDVAAVTNPLQIPCKALDTLSIRVDRPDGSIATAPAIVLVSFEVV